MPTEHVFLCQVVNAWEVICPLIWLHTLEQFNRDWSVVPGDIPLSVLPSRQVELKVELGDLFDHIIVRVLGEHDEAVRAVGDVLRVQFTLFLFFVTRREPIRVVRCVVSAGVELV